MPNRTLSGSRDRISNSGFPAMGPDGCGDIDAPLNGWIRSQSNDTRPGRAEHPDGPDAQRPAPGPRRRAQIRGRLLPRRRLRLVRPRRPARRHPRHRRGHAPASPTGSPRRPWSCRSSPAGCCCGRPTSWSCTRASAAALVVEAALFGPYDEGPDADHPGHGPGRRRGRVLRAADRAVPQPGRGALAARRHHALRPARTHPGPEQAARAARGLAPRDGAAPGRRPVLLRRLRRRRPHPRRPHPRSGAHRCLRQGHGRRLPRPAAVRRLRRPARLAAAARLPARRQRLSAAPGLGRGLRDLHPPRPRPGIGRLRTALRRPSAGPPAQRRQRPLGGEVGRGAAARRLRRRRVRPGQGARCGRATC